MYNVIYDRINIDIRENTGIGNQLSFESFVFYLYANNLQHTFVVV